MSDEKTLPSTNPAPSALDEYMRARLGDRRYEESRKAREAFDPLKLPPPDLTPKSVMMPAPSPFTGRAVPSDDITIRPARVLPPMVATPPGAAPAAPSTIAPSAPPLATTTTSLGGSSTPGEYGGLAIGIQAPKVQTRKSAAAAEKQGRPGDAHDIRMEGQGLSEDYFKSGQEWAEDAAGSVIGTLAWALDNFDVPRQAAWAGTAKGLEAVLPEEGLARDAITQVGGTIGHLAWQGVGERDQWVEAAGNLYQAIVSGALTEQGNDSLVRTVPFIGDIPKIDGLDVIDAALPTDLVNRMVEADGWQGPVTTTFKNIYGTPLGRMTAGITIEAIFDPLNAAGGAGAAVKFASKTGDVYALARGAERVAAAAALARSGENAATGLRAAREAVVSVANGLDDAEEAGRYLRESADIMDRKAGEVLREAEGFRVARADPEAGAKLVIADAEKLRDEALALALKGSNPKQIARLEREAERLTTLADVIAAGDKASVEKLARGKESIAAAYRVKAQRIREFADAGVDAAKAPKRGGLAWHLPGSERTRYLTSRPLLDYPGALAAKTGGWFDKKILDGADLARDSRPLWAMNAGERLALAVHAAAGPATWAKGHAASVWSAVHLAVGDRFFKPLVARASLQALQEATGVPVTKLLRNVPDHLWQTYQDAMNRFMNRAMSRESSLISGMKSWTAAGERLWRNRKSIAADTVAQGQRALAAARTDREVAAARELIAAGERWGSSTYTIQHVLDEAAEAVESGAGLLNGAEGLAIRPLADALRGVVSRISTGLEQDLATVEQAAISIARHAKGDPELYASLTSDLVRAVKSGSISGLEKYDLPRELFSKENRAGTLEAIRKLQGSEKSTKIVKADAAGAIRKLLADLKPRIDFKLIDHERDLEKWEVELWSEMKKLTAERPPEHVMMAAMLAAKNSPKADTEAYEILMRSYGQVVGTRLGDLPDDILPVVTELRRILVSYEDAYETAGFAFVKKRMERLRDLGVIDYVPHTQSDFVDIASGRKVVGSIDTNAVASGSGRGPGVDSQLSGALKQSKKRKTPGTMREINARERSLRNHVDELAEAAKQSSSKVVEFHLDPQVMLSRYMAANRALNATEMLVELHDGGVLKIFDNTDDAIAEGFVPLFTRGERSRDTNFVNAPRETLDAIRERDLLKSELAGRIAAGGTISDSTIFASWGITNRDMARAAMVEDALTYAKIAVHEGGSLVDGVRLTDPLLDRSMRDGVLDFDTMWAAAMEATDGNADAASDLATNLVNKLIAGTGGKVAPEWIKPKAWREPMSRLYAPAQVVQSMSDIFGPGTTPNGAEKFLIWFSGFWKERLTSMRIAFSNRNLTANMFSQVMANGLMTALDPITNMTAGRLAAANMIATAYGGGSLTRALEAIRQSEAVAGQGILKGAEAAVDNATKAGAQALAAGAGLTGRQTAQLRELGWTAESLVRDLGDMVDLGDGIPRSWDDALALCRDNGVVNFQYGAGQIDIALAEKGLLEAVTGQGGWERMAKIGGAMEDGAVFAITGLGSGGFPVTFPRKAWGAKYAEFIENQARLNVFVGNMKRTGSIDQAAAKVNEVLFNYGDLTHFQKRWMRLAFPFFTWEFKNFKLMTTAMTENPAFFAMADRLFVDDLPEAAGGRVTEESLAERMPYAVNQLTLPYPELGPDGKLRFSDVKAVGLGTPIEALFGTFGMGVQLFETFTGDSVYHHGEVPSILSKSHFMLPILWEVATKYDTFYQQDLSTIPPRKLLGLWHMLYSVSPPAATVLARDVAMLHGYTDGGEMKISPGAGGIWMNAAIDWSPYSPVINDAMAYNSMRSLYFDEGGELHSMDENIPFRMRMLTALSGLKPDRTDAETTAYLKARELHDAMQAEEDSRLVPK